MKISGITVFYNATATMRIFCARKDVAFLKQFVLRKTMVGKNVIALLPESYSGPAE